MKLPAIQWYPGDWLRDPGVQALSYEDQGIWFAILMRMWEGEERGKLTLNGAAMPVEALARLLGLDNQKVNQTLTTLSTYGVTSVEPNTGIIFSRRMVRDEQLRNIRVECGKKGGNPRLVNQKSNQSLTTGVKQIPTPSSSSSSSIQTHTEPSAVPASVKAKGPWRNSHQAAWFDDWWKVVWAKVGKGGAEKAFAKAATNLLVAEEIIAATKKQLPRILEREPQYRPHPATWLNDKRWLDEPEPSVNGARQQQSSLPDFDDLINDPYHGGPGR